MFNSDKFLSLVILADEAFLLERHGGSVVTIYNFDDTSSNPTTCSKNKE